MSEDLLQKRIDAVRMEQFRLEKILGHLWEINALSAGGSDRWFTEIHKAIARVQDEEQLLDREIGLLKRDIAQVSGLEL